MQFKIENENTLDNCINSLINPLHKNCLVETNWYRKDTFSARNINIFSHQPTKQKVAIIYNIIYKCILLSNKKFHQDNINTAKTFLFANNYPLKFTNIYISRKLAHLSNNNKIVNCIDNISKNILVIFFHKYLNDYIIISLKNSNIFVLN